MLPKCHLCTSRAKRNAEMFSRISSINQQFGFLVVKETRITWERKLNNLEINLRQKGKKYLFKAVVRVMPRLFLVSREVITFHSDKIPNYILFHSFFLKQIVFHRLTKETKLFAGLIINIYFILPKQMNSRLHDITGVLREPAAHSAYSFVFWETVYFVLLTMLIKKYLRNTSVY